MALPLVWLFNLVGITDLLFAAVQGVITGLPFSHIGVDWFIPTVYVPLLLGTILEEEWTRKYALFPGPLLSIIL